MRTARAAKPLPAGDENAAGLASLYWRHARVCSAIRALEKLDQARRKRPAGIAALLRARGPGLSLAG